MQTRKICVPSVSKRKLVDTEGGLQAANLHVALSFAPQPKLWEFQLSAKSLGLSVAIATKDLAIRQGIISTSVDSFNVVSFPASWLPSFATISIDQLLVASSTVAVRSPFTLTLAT